MSKEKIEKLCRKVFEEEFLKDMDMILRNKDDKLTIPRHKDYDIASINDHPPKRYPILDIEDHKFFRRKRWAIRNKINFFINQI